MDGLDFICNRGRKLIGQYIARCSNLKRLRMDVYLKDTEQSLSVIFQSASKVFQGDHSLEEFELNIIRLAGPADDNDRRRCQYEVHTVCGAPHLVSYLKRAPFLRRISLLSGFSVSNHCLRQLASALEGKPIEYLLLSGHYNTSLAEVVNALDATTLECLNIRSHSIGIDTFEAIASILSHERSVLKEVYVASLNDESIRVLCCSLSQNTSLETLDVNHGGASQVTEVGWVKVERLLYNGSNIQSVLNSNRTIKHFGHQSGFMIRTRKANVHRLLEINNHGRLREKVAMYLASSSSSGGFNVDPFLEIDNAKVMPYALGFVSKQCPNQQSLSNIYNVVRNWEMPSLFGYPSLEQLTDENVNLREENAMLRDEVSQLRSKLAAVGLS